MRAAGRPPAPTSQTFSTRRLPRNIIVAASGTMAPGSSSSSPTPPPSAARATSNAAADKKNDARRTDAAANDEDDNDDDPAMLAPRSRRARQPSLSYYGAFVKASRDLYDPQDNPNGSIVVSVAENRLSPMKQRAADALDSASPPPVSSLGYLNFRGIEPLRMALAKAMLRTLLLSGRSGPALSAASEEQDLEDEERRRLVADMFLACGAGSVVDLLFHLLASPGDGVLIPAPYYPAFDNDLVVRNGLVPIPLYLQGLDDGVDRSSKAAFAFESGDRQTKTFAEQLDAAVEAWEASAAEEARRGGGGGGGAGGGRVRALLLTNPSNPLGTTLRRSHLLEMARWAHARGVHLVCDEVYGAMVWGQEDEQDDEGSFVSAWRLLTDGAFAQEQNQQQQARAELLTHVIWGLSKDMCASGLRVGVLLTRNPGIAASWGNLSYFAGVPFPLQYRLASVLSDDEWVDAFRKDNCAALRASWETLSGALTGAGIPHVKKGVGAAMFCWIDLREGLLLPLPSEGSGGEEASEDAKWEGERELWRALVSKAKVVLTPGEACHAPEPGFFRMCWAWMPREALPVAVARVRRLLDERSIGAKKKVN